MRPLAQALAAGAASAACFCAGDALAAAAAASGFPACDAPVLLSAIPETGLAAEPMALAVGLMAACIPWAVWARSLVRAGTYRQGEEHGSARWGTLKEGRAFMDRKDKANNILLSRDFALALKPKRFDLKHDRNRNVCVLGGPGSGKTRYYVKPNLMQANADFLVTDPKGTLLGDVGWMLEDAGYDIRTFDTTDFSRSMHYNPLSYVKDQADILVFVECLIKNTTPDDRKGSDPFWENSERLLYTALVAYLVYHARPEERDLNSLMLLLSLAEAREEDESYMSPSRPHIRGARDGHALHGARARARGAGRAPLRRRGRLGLGPHRRAPRPGGGLRAVELPRLQGGGREDPEVDHH